MTINHTLAERGGVERLTTPELIARARAVVDAMTPEQHKAMIDAQRESWIRAFAPCEHGDPDWETCPGCLAKYAPDERAGTGEQEQQANQGDKP